MMWGCITSKGKGILLPVDGTITSSKYCQVLQDGLLPTIDWYYPDSNCIFVQDNTPCHKSAETLEWLNDRQIRVSQWPPQSPDMNIIENLWRLMKIELGKVTDTINSRQDLIHALLQICREIPDEKYFSLYQSLPARMRAAVKSKGTMTQY